jgi:hypothetical protein
MIYGHHSIRVMHIKDERKGVEFIFRQTGTKKNNR